MIEVEIGAEKSNQLAVPEIVYNEESKQYEFTIEIDGTMPNGIYSIFYIVITDKAGNYLNFSIYDENPIDLSVADFKVVNSINGYEELIKSVTIDKKQPQIGDTINISIELANNFYIGSVEIPYKNSDKEKYIKLDYNQVTNRYEGRLTIDKNTEIGIWRPEYIEFTSNSEKWITSVSVEYYGLRDKFEFEVIKSGWINKNGKWYYYNQDGEMYKGWLNLKGTWYYLDDSGAMQTGWLNLKGTWYYLDNSGAMQTGWLNLKETWYYLDGSGAMQTGWLNLNGTWYYMYGSGKMATNTIIDGWKIGSNGVATPIK